MSIQKFPFGRLPDGAPASLYVLSLPDGFSVSISDFGGTLVSLLAPDRTGRLTDVLCGFESAEAYARADGYLGATVGRYCNRLAGGRFELNGKTYELYCNNGQNHLHGGKRGFSHRLWEVANIQDGDQPSLTLCLFSPDGDEGYPGNLSLSATYALSADHALSIHYNATVDQASPVSLTNHAYFNLGGFASGDVLSHVLWLDAESYLRTDAGLIPTGELVPVEGTPFDFRTPKPIGQDLSLTHPDLALAGGYDHCVNFTGWQENSHAVRLRGSLYHSTSGRKLELLTSSPCMQLYTANFLKNPAFPLKGGYPQQPQHAVCLETQLMPDSPNHPAFTDSILHPGEVYDYTTVYRFSVLRDE